MARSSPATPHAAELASEIADAERLLAEGCALEDVWRHLRAAGLGMIDSDRVTMAVTGLSAREAQRAVYLSETWADMRPAVDQLQDDIIQAALDMGAEVRIDGRRITDLSQL